MLVVIILIKYKKFNEKSINRNINLVFNSHKNNNKNKEKNAKNSRPLTPNLNIIRKSSAPICENNANKFISKIKNDNGYLIEECKKYIKNIDNNIYKEKESNRTIDININNNSGFNQDDMNRYIMILLMKRMMFKKIIIILIKRNQIKIVQITVQIILIVKYLFHLILIKVFNLRKK